MERLGLKHNLKFKKKNNVKQKIGILFVLIAVFIVLFEFFSYQFEPTVIALCEIKAQSIGIMVSNKAVTEIMMGLEYSDLIVLERGENGSILALRANAIEMNRLSAIVSSRMQELYNSIEDAYIYIPIGSFTGNSLLSGRGPDVVVRIVPARCGSC